MLRSSSCDCTDASMLVKGTISMAAKSGDNPIVITKK